jgi:hypothetical protein
MTNQGDDAMFTPTTDRLTDVLRNLRALATLRSHLLDLAQTRPLTSEENDAFRGLTWVLVVARSFLGRLPAGIDADLYFSPTKAAQAARERARAPHAPAPVEPIAP